MSLTDRVKARAKHPTGGAVTGRLAAHDPRSNARVNGVADRFGHGKGVQGTSIDDAKAHNSAPLSTLQDPSSFGPPPKHIHFHGEAAASAISSPVSRNAPALPAPRSAPSKPATAVSSRPARATQAATGLGAPIPQEAISTQQDREEEEAEPAPPPMPYRANTTGLTTAGLPKPPVRRVEYAEDPYNDAPRPAPAAPSTRSKPQPPPRLPARQNSNPTEYTPSPPPAYSAAVQHPEPMPQQPAAPTSMNQLSELQSRFSKLPGRVTSPEAQLPTKPTRPTQSQAPTPSSPAAQGQGTTWAQKQAALRTASQFNKDPSSVSVSDARQAASTAQDFHQRHGEQVASGWQKAKALDSKYSVRGKMGGLVAAQGQGQQAAQASLPDVGGASRPQPPVVAGGGASTAAAGKKAPPPPPPPKKKALQDVHPSGADESNDAPPPIPLSSKPGR